jgi:hypothetical protein
MKTLTALLIGSLTVLSMSPAMADHRHHRHRECFEVYERWEPGYYDSYGHWRRGRMVSDTRPTPCRGYHTHHHTHERVIIRERVSEPKKNSVGNERCKNGAVLGALGGAGAAWGLSKKDAYIWSIPLGAVVGAGVGCELAN